jgi:outer membrane protein assembly factor BamB/TolA-binding protein
MPVLLAAACVFGGTLDLIAQQQIQGQRAGQEGSSAPRDLTGVYVRDSAVAVEKLALAQRMERLKEWDKSADVYQEIVEKYADRVVPNQTDPTGADPAGAPRSYSSVTLEVQRRMSKWPDEGIHAYQARFEAPAAAMLEAAGVDDAAALNKILSEYFPTDAAKAAGLRLIELYIENGEFPAAAWLGERLLQYHRNLGPTDEPRLMFRTALADHLAGQEAAAQAQLDALKHKYPKAAGTVRGKSVVLAETLAELLTAPVPVARGASADSWPIFGGDIGRGRVPAAGGRSGARLVEVSYDRPKRRPIPNAEQRAQIDNLQRQTRESGLLIGVMPVVDRGELFFQDNKRVYAVGLESGLPLAGWENQSPLTDASKRYAPANSPLPGSTQMTVTVTDRRVLAVLGLSDRGAMMNEAGNIVAVGGDQNSQLVCLDRATGAKIWAVSPRQFPEPQANLRTLSLTGSPLVVGDNVYIAARGGKPMQFEDAYVLCLSLAEGKLNWACYLASGNAGVEGFNMPGMMWDNVSHLAYSGGRVYAVSNIGAIASVDAYSGTIVWLNLYPRPAANFGGNFAPQFNPGNVAGMAKPWSHNPVIVKDGKVFALPRDTNSALVYDAGTGAQIKRIPMGDFEDAETLLGVLDDKLIVCGDRSVFCIDWPHFDPAKPRNDNLLWKSEFVGRDQQTKDTIRGRGFVTADSVFICSQWGLHRIDMKSGRVSETYPKDGTWSDGEGPGNVLVTQDHVILAGADGVDVYADLAMARSKLDQAVAAAPTDPRPRLEYAEVMFTAGQVDTSVAKLDEAINLLGGLTSMRRGADRDRAFSDSLTFAQRLANPKVGTTDVARAASLYDRAGAAASTPQQNVNYRLSRARFAAAQRAFADEVRLYQEILSNPSWRSVPVMNDEPGPTSASAVAEAAIGQRIRDSKGVYDVFERQASDALVKARATTQPAQMLAVAQTYPNAKVAPEAMLAAAETFEAAGQPRPATQVLNQLYYKYRDSADKARVIEAVARNYLALPGGVSVAIGRLSEGARTLNNPPLARPLKLPDGTTIENVSFGAAAELLQKYSITLTSASLPDFHIPMTDATRKHVKPFLPETPGATIADVDLLLVPPNELRDFARYDRLVTWSAGSGVRIFPVGTNRAIGANPSFTSPPRGAAWMGKDVLIWTNDKIALLKGDTASTAWEVPLRSLPPAEVVTGGDVVRQGPVDGANGNADVIINPRGGIIIDNQVINFRRGLQVAQPNIQVGIFARRNRNRVPRDAAEHIEHVRPSGDRVVIGTSTGRLASLELSDGRVAWQTRVGEMPIDQMLASDDFIAVRFVDEFGAQIVAIETYGGQIVMRRLFGPEAAPGPINMALSADGTLVYTLQDRVCGKDLYEPGKSLKFGDSTPSEGNPIFVGAAGPEQLLIAGSRILAVADSGQFVRMFSTDTGKAIDQPLGTGSSNWNVALRVIGPRLYVINQRGVTSYNLEKTEDVWTSSDPGRGPLIRDAFIGKQHIVLLGQMMPGVLAGLAGGGDGRDPAIAPAAASARFRLIAYGRYPKVLGSTDESGRLDQDPDIVHRVGIDQWQPVEGGFYYRSVDGKLHFLKGAGQ